MWGRTGEFGTLQTERRKDGDLRPPEPVWQEHGQAASRREQASHTHLHLQSCAGTCGRH